MMLKNIFLKFTFFSMTLLMFGCYSIRTPAVYDYIVTVHVSATADTSIDQKKYNKCYLVTEYDMKTIKGRQYASFFKDNFSTMGIEITSDKSQANCILFAVFDAKPDKYFTNGYIRFILNRSLNMSAETKEGKEIWTVYVDKTDIIRTADDVERTMGDDDVVPVLINAASTFSRTNEKTNWSYSSLELELLHQHRARELTKGGETRLRPLTGRVPNIDTVANWNACDGEMMIDVLTRWTKRTGYKLLVDDKIRNPRVEYDQPYQGKFVDVLSQYLTPQGLRPILDTSRKTLSLSENE